MIPRVVTGVGVVSPIGVGRGAFVESLRAGARPPWEDGRVESFDATAYPNPRIAEVRGFDATQYLGDKGLRTLDRLAKLLVVATRLALRDAGLKDAGAWLAPAGAERPWTERTGIVVSNAYGSLETITELDRVAVLEDARYINPSRFPLTVSNSAAGYASIWEDLRAVNVSVSDGNCGALDAVACADLLLDERRADVLLVGGAESMSEALFLAFDRMRALGARAEASDGPFLGEGAGLVVLERRGTAKARGATALAEIVGYGTAFASPEREGALVNPTPDAAEQAIGLALADAGVAASDVDLVVSGVSGLRAFDDAELLAITRTVGDGVCVVAPKLALGETLGAGGAMAILTATGFLGPVASPTHVVRGALRRPARTAVVTSLGYYGNASALVMRSSSR